MSCKKLDISHFLRKDRSLVESFVTPNPLGLDALVGKLLGFEVKAVIESKSGARFIHDYLENEGWDVKMADTRKAKRLAPFTCKTDKIDARVLAELSFMDIVPEIWPPSIEIHNLRELSRYRILLVHKCTNLKNRIHSILIQFQVPAPTSDIYGTCGR
ncbi:MAG: transposase [Acidimicrobiales bacterium]|nr:transposase [Acidimicrobiales bacterium]